MKIRVLLLVFLFWASVCHAQDDVMMQAFYWNVPVDDASNNGSWWDNLASKASELSDAGISGIWTPSPAKGNFGIYDMGYGIFDHYDLGNYDQKGTIETRFGSRAELLNMVNAMHKEGIQVYVDVVLNHIYTGDSEAQANPAVRQYVFDEAKRNGSQFASYPTNEITWRIPNADPGDYYIKIKGYNLNCGATHFERAYDLTMNWDGSADDNSTIHWEFEPNNGGGDHNPFPASGQHLWAHINSCGDIDEYKAIITTTHDFTIKLSARRDVNGNLQWADQNNGYYPYEIWHNGRNLAFSTLEASTNTGVKYVVHTGADEPNYGWTYTDFHPVDQNDWLGGPGGDEIIANTKFFGNDLNTFSPLVQERLQNWGAWLTNTVGYDGYRLDFVRGFQESFAAGWIKAMPKLNGKQRFVVGEYWGSPQRIQAWVNDLASQGADADGFDFPLKSALTQMANGDSSWDMRWLNHAGMVRNNQGQSLPGASVVTFVDNHDTGKESDKWVQKDWRMAYAYILFAEGRPCVFYPHFYGVVQTDAHDDQFSIVAPISLQNDIKELIRMRKTYLDGELIVLSEVGNPWPADDAKNVFVARRQGHGEKTGAILVINNHKSQTKGLWVDHAPGAGYPIWADRMLVNAFDGTQKTHVYPDGRVYVSAPPRGYAVYVPQNEYLAVY